MILDLSMKKKSRYSVSASLSVPWWLSAKAKRQYSCARDWFQKKRETASGLSKSALSVRDPGSAMHKEGPKARSIGRTFVS